MTRAYSYLICKGYNKTSKRFKRRNRVVKKYTCKKHWQLDMLMSSFSNIEDLALDNEDPNSYTIYVNNAITKLKPFLPFMIRYYELRILPRERNYRSGFETYGYEYDESIIENLQYISDKWQDKYNAAFRLRWLINLVDKDYTYTGKELVYDYDKQPIKYKYDWNYNLEQAPIGKFVIVEVESTCIFKVAKRRRDGSFICKDKTTKTKVVLTDVVRFQLCKYKINSYYDPWWRSRII